MAESATASQTELKSSKTPIGWRDQCSAREKSYMPWECNDQRHAYEKCQYDDYMRRMKELSKRKLAAAEEE